MITDVLYDKVSRVIPEIEWPFHSPYIDEINKLKQDTKKIKIPAE